MDKFSKGKPGGASKTKNSKFYLVQQQQQQNHNNNKAKQDRLSFPRILIAYTIYQNLVKTQL